MNLSILAAKVLVLLLPESMLGFVYKLLVGKESISLCLHRVTRQRSKFNPYPPTTIEESKLDKIIEHSLPIHKKTGSYFTLSFDDGYKDALEYYLKNKQQYSGAEWQFYICPIKSKVRSGFTWDFYEKSCEEGALHEDFSHFLKKIQAMNDNQRESLLKDLGNDSRFLLAQPYEWKQISQDQNVILGNHSNFHLSFADLNEKNMLHEIEESIRDFNDLFGETQHFAFPYGTPYIRFTKRNVQALREKSNYIIWSTAEYSYQKKERSLGNVMPRIVVDGTLEWQEVFMYIAVRSTITRVIRVLRRKKSFHKEWN